MDQINFNHISKSSISITLLNLHIILILVPIQKLMTEFTDTGTTLLKWRQTHELGYWCNVCYIKKYVSQIVEYVDQIIPMVISSINRVAKF